MDAELADDPRQRVADIVAVMVLTQLNLNGADADCSRLGAMVAAYCAGEGPAALQKYSEMDWPTAMRAIKVAFARHHLATKEGRSDELPAAADENIGKCVVAAFLKFGAFQSINPGWYAPHLEGMRLAAEPMPGR